MTRTNTILLLSYLFVTFFLANQAFGNNVHVDSLRWDGTSVGGQDVLKMTMWVSWDNSWRDDFNYDAAYVFFKFKLKELDAESAPEQWHHLYLLDEGHEVSGGDFGYWLSPLSVKGQNYNTGIYLFRNKKGGGNNRIKLTVAWNIKNQLGVSLTGNDFIHQQVLVSAHALEMVYVPRGAFRIGDGVSEKTFRRAWFPIEREYDLVDKKYTFLTANRDDRDPRLAADKINDNNQSLTSVWSTTADGWWVIDFGEGNEKAVKWFGVNAYKHAPNNLPVTFELRGGGDPASTEWDLLWSGPGAGNWVMADDAYPVQKAIQVDPDKVKPYRSYMLQVVGMKSGTPMVTSIALSDSDLEKLVNPTVLIDGLRTPKDTLRYLSARDGSDWTSGEIPTTFPNGFRGFYAMKYELSQDQYVRFLNKLTYQQQNSILSNALGNLREGDYIFGAKDAPSCRNGIVVATKMKNRPAVFTCRLTADGNMDTDGHNLACNYMNIADMMAYADWAGLRPLSEMEYEKMARPGYPYVPRGGEFAWNTTHIEEAGNLNEAGSTRERPARGNAVYGNNVSIGGPVRCGAFATQRPEEANREFTGAGFSGVMELSGNLAEMYYNANHTDGLNMVAESCSGTTHVTAHGDGYLDVNGRYDGVKNSSKYWKAGPAYIALRGGSFADPAEKLAVSDRSRFSGALATLYTRDSTVTFRLGRSVPEQAQLVSVLTLENGNTTLTGAANDLLDNSMRSYTIRGNKPDGIEGAYTYIWYMMEQGGKWKVLEGEDDANFVLKGFAEDTRIAQYYHLKRKVITPFTDSESSSAKEVVLSRKAIVFNGHYRSWADGTFARSAMEYRYPADPYKYEGAIGNGVYRIDPDGPAGPVQPFDVYCDMETTGGGWMLAAKFSNHDEKNWIATREIWTDTTTLGDATDTRNFRDAKSKVWSLYAADSLLFKTMRKEDKAFETTTRLGKRTLSAFFKTALASFPNLKQTLCYTTLNIRFLNGAVAGDFEWISGTAFEKGMITIGNSDADDTGADSMGVISGWLADPKASGNRDADSGLGVSNTPRFGTGEQESDVGTKGGSGKADKNNVLLFVK